MVVGARPYNRAASGLHSNSSAVWAAPTVEQSLLHIFYFSD